MDGHDIKSLNIKWLRSHIGYVGQEPILFAGTIGENIAYGLNGDLKGSTSVKDSQKDSQKEKSDNLSENLMSQVIAAAKLANAHQFISEFPQGYNTDVGSNGVAMSGGQKQRIAIARALIKKPAVLLLDEATSALDATSEKIVQQSIDALAKSKAQTTIIIAHRLSTIRNADKICAIKDGKIVEVGTHDELLAKNGIYADLIRLQMEAGEEDVEHPLVETQVEEIAIAHRGERARTESQDRVRAQSIEKPKDTSAAVASKAPELTSTESKAISRRVWSLILQYPLLFSTGLFGACWFGAVFPCWGLMLAQSQNMFYLQDPNELKSRARLYACYYILLAGSALLASTAQYYGTIAVSPF